MKLLSITVLVIALVAVASAETSFGEYAKKMNIPIRAEVQRSSLTVSNEDLATEDLDSRSHKNGPTCMLCKTIMKEVFKYLKDDRTEKQIEESLKKVCQFAFKEGPKRDRCDELVSAYTRELIDLLAEESDPEMICMLIEQCTYATVNKKVNIPDEPERNTAQEDADVEKSPTFNEFISMLDPDVKLNSLLSCMECKAFISYLQHTCKDQRTRDSLKNWLTKNLCNILEEPKARESCISMVDQYSDDFFKAVAEELDPQSVCVNLKSCKRKRVSFLEFLQESGPLAAFQPNRKFANPACDQCVEIVTNLDEYLSSHSIDHDVSVLVEQVCNKLPDEGAKNTCATLVKTFGNRIVELIHTMDNPRQLCEKMYLC